LDRYRDNVSECSYMSNRGMILSNKNYIKRACQVQRGHHHLIDMYLVLTMI